MPRQTGGDVDDEIDGDIAEQEESDVRGPGMEKNPDRAMRQGSRREMPRIEASVGNQRKDCDEKREQTPILAMDAF